MRQENTSEGLSSNFPAGEASILIHVGEYTVNRTRSETTQRGSTSALDDAVVDRMQGSMFNLFSGVLRRSLALSAQSLGVVTAPALHQHQLLLRNVS